MAVFIPGVAVVESALVGETEAAHELQGFTDKLRVYFTAALRKKLGELRYGDMVFGLQEYFENFKSIFKIINIFLFKQFFELFFFLKVNLFHKGYFGGPGIS
jgi:hypothetical protein